MREPFVAVYAAGRRGGSGWFVMVRVDARAFCGGVRYRASRGFRVVCNGSGWCASLLWRCTLPGVAGVQGGL